MTDIRDKLRDRRNDGHLNAEAFREIEWLDADLKEEKKRTAILAYCEAFIWGEMKGGKLYLSRDKCPGWNVRWEAPDCGYVWEKYLAGDLWTWNPEELAKKHACEARQQAAESKTT